MLFALSLKIFTYDLYFWSNGFGMSLKNIALIIKIKHEI